MQNTVDLKRALLKRVGLAERNILVFFSKLLQVHSLIAEQNRWAANEVTLYGAASLGASYILDQDAGTTSWWNLEQFPAVVIRCTISRLFGSSTVTDSIWDSSSTLGPTLFYEQHIPHKSPDECWVRAVPLCAALLPTSDETSASSSDNASTSHAMRAVPVGKTALYRRPTDGRIGTL